ncbi:MAG: hypothetical protein JNM10_03615 [Planctomycetia bacterium]|nr:hypothetical protein [Planctomycetia bacterium]
MKRRRLLVSLVPLCAAVAAVVAARGREPFASADGPPAAAPAATAPAPAEPWAVPAALPATATRYTRFETLTTKDGLPSDHVTCVLAEPAPGGELVVGTDRGVAIRRGATWTRHDEASGLSHDVVTSLARDPATGDLWVGTVRGATRVSGGRLRVYHQLNSGLINDIVYHVVVDGPRVWFATQGGASVLDVASGAWAVWDHRNSIMHEPWCYAVAVGPGRTWIGLWGGGVIERETATGQWREHRDPDGEMELDLDRDDGPIHEVSSFVAYDAGVLWQGTYFGLSRFDGRRWRAYTAKDTGLPGDFVQHVAARGRTVWMGTDQGFGVFDGTTCRAYRREADGSCVVTTRVDGGPPTTTHLATAPGDNYVLWVQPGADDVWLATGHGLSHGFATADPAPTLPSDPAAPRR